MSRPSATRFRFALVGLLSASPAFAGSLKVVDPAQLPQHWQLAPGAAAASYPAQAKGAGCVQLGFRIDSQGRVVEPILLRAWSEAADPDSRQRDLFARHAAAALAQWRFEPTATTRRRDVEVFTSAGFVFLPAGVSDAVGARERCAIPDLSDFVTQAQRRVGQRGSLLLSRMDAKREFDPALIPFQKHDWFDGSIGPTGP